VVPSSEGYSSKKYNALHLSADFFQEIYVP
jgi:hypothetical protein